MSEAQPGAGRFPPPDCLSVLHVVHGFPPEYQGGTECYVRHLARTQSAQGHSVHVLTGTHVTAPRASLEAVESDGISLYRLRRHGLCGDRWDHTESADAEGRVRALLRSLRPDVVHVHHWIRLCRSVVRLAASAGIPAVWTQHDLSTTCPRFNRVLDDGTLCSRPLAAESCLGCAPNDPWQHPEEVREAIERYRADLAAELRAASLLITPSVAQRDVLVPHHELPAHRYRHVPHGVLHRIRPPAARRPDPDGRLRLVSWGHWYRDKGVHLLMEALHRLGEDVRRRVHLTLYGCAVFPDYGRSIEEQAAGLPVELPGPFEPERLPGERFDLAVFASLAHESHSFVLDEAFQLGLPVLASRIGALGERVGGAGRLFPPGNTAALAAAIEEAIGAPQLVEAWRAAIPTERVAMEDHAVALEGIYREVVEAGPPADAPPPPPRSSDRRLRERSLANRELEIHRLRHRLATGADG